MDYYKEKFFTKVIKTDTCWLWNAGCDRNGYGQFWNGKKTIQAHRFSWVLARDDTCERKHILSSCGNKKCVNPAHLLG